MQKNVFQKNPSSLHDKSVAETRDRRFIPHIIKGICD
jgi:hypothetical protein